MNKPAPPSIRCRQIGPPDLARIAELLTRGFPGRSRAYWTKGLATLAARQVPAGCPRFGYMLESGGVAVGVLLLIFSEIPTSGGPQLRCNLSSWYVDPGFRSHAALLSVVPLKFKQATHINISAAPNTWATIEAQGFARYTAGQLVALPSLAHAEPGLHVDRLRSGSPLPDVVPEAALLAEHAGLGCTCLVGHAPDGPHPFAFLPVRIRRGHIGLPAMQLVFCRSLDDVVRFAAPIGRHLLRAGKPFLVLDAPGPLPGLPGIYLPDRAPKSFKGPQAPRPGDLAFTEFVMFGP